MYTSNRSVEWHNVYLVAKIFFQVEEIEKNVIFPLFPK